MYLPPRSPMQEQTPADLARHLRKTKRLRLDWDR